MNNFHRLHAACSAYLRRLPLPVPFDLDEFCRRIGAERSRPLVVLPWESAMPAGITGTCMPYGDRDVIYHQPWATGLHRTQIVLHEIAHLVCGHVAHDTLSSQFEMVQPGIHARMFARHDNYGDEQEREAEMLASLMMEHAVTHAARTDDALVARLHAALAPTMRSASRG
ncbi:hypothetical protein GCM10009839_58340 [Catenulispora yoronensis]|uniref:IrrE N-terminal-like domain-containing protein n=1 Tax=Catenulispora yoronensis TaxID=450799 RepID=A0ABN2V1M4_9ACTN